MSSERVEWPLQAMTATVMLAYWWFGGWPLLAVGAAACLLLAPWIPWRYNPGRRLGEWLYALVALPFIVFALSEGRDQSATELLASSEFTQLSTAYLLALAVQEQYRRADIRKIVIVHLALLGVLFNAGRSYEVSGYPLLVSLYAVGLVWWLRGTPVRSALPPWSRRMAVVGGSFLAMIIAAGVAGTLFVYLRQAEFQVMAAYRKMLMVSGPTLMGPVRESQLGSLPEMFASTSILARWFGSNPQYLRTHVLVTYSQGRWRPPAMESTGGAHSVVLVTDPVDSPLVARALGPVYHFPGPVPTGASLTGSVLEDGFGTILSPYGTWAVSTGGSGGGVKSDPMGILRSTGGISAYEAQLAWNPALAEDLSGQSHEDPAYLDLGPSPLQPRVAALAGRIVGSATRPEDEAQAIKDWLQQTCTYSLQTGARPGAEPMDSFLFSDHRGYCEYFATAMALMLRARGIRCRYVLGYLIKERNQLGGYWIIRARDAHAWLEVYLPGRGWTLWDPTPPAETEAEAYPSASWLSQLMDQYGLWFARFWASVQSGNWKLFLRDILGYVKGLAVRAGPWATPFVLAGIGWLAMVAWRRRRGGGARRIRLQRTPVEPGMKVVRQALARVERRLARQGHVRAPQETLMEFGARVEDQALREVVLLHCRCRYQGEPLAEPATRRLKGLR